MSKNKMRLAYDMHLHSCLSPCGDDNMTPAMICGLAKVAGLDIIALTDHNSCANCPAFLEAAEHYGIKAICGMELTTAEEVHVLCYFHSLDLAMRFSDYVHDHLLPIKNKPSIFGHQYTVDTDDNVLYEEETLLVSATDISFDQVSDILEDYGGVMVPAHINKTSTSVLSNLGLIPEDSKFKCAEIKLTAGAVGSETSSIESLASELQEQHPYLKKCRLLINSDAHTLNDIQEPIHFIEIKDDTTDAILDYLAGK